MSNVTQQKNANRIFIAGMQFTEKTIKNACQCTLKQNSISMGGIKRTKTPNHNTKTSWITVNTVKQDWPLNRLRLKQTPDLLLVQNVLKSRKLLSFKMERKKF